MKYQQQAAVTSSSVKNKTIIGLKFKHKINQTKPIHVKNKTIIGLKWNRLSTFRYGRDG